MINVSIVRDQLGFIWQLTVKGHARYAKSGRDIICAAASVTAYTAVGALEDLAEIPDCHTEKDGYLSISIPLSISEKQKQVAGIIMETTAIGFKQIEMQYPNYLSVLDEEV